MTSTLASQQHCPVHPAVQYPLSTLFSQSRQQHSFLPRTRSSTCTLRSTGENRRISDYETTSLKSATRCCCAPPISRSPPTASDQRGGCVLCTLAISHLWNSTHQSPLASSCLHSSSSSMSTHSVITCHPQKHLVPESQHHRIPLLSMTMKSTRRKKF